MSSVTENEGKVLTSAEPTKKTGNFEIYVIGAIVLGVAALLAYQFLFCAACYS